ncbi:MAG TPA: KTSC domain-containing protein [Nitrososphaeraceae archaeon]
MNRRQQLEALLDELLRGVQDVLMSGEILTDEFQGMIAQEIETLVNEIDQLITQEQIPSNGELPTPQDTQPVITPPLNPSLQGSQEQPILDESYPSSNVNSFGYNPETQQLYVKFQGDYPLENGPVYAYEGVPKVIFDLFQKGAVPARTDGENEWGSWFKGKVPSIGSSLYTLIKQGGYAFHRLT